MVIAYRFGHNPLCRGAVSDLLDECNENRAYGDRVIGYLREEGMECIDCTPEDNSSSSQELGEGVTNANNSGADLFISFHLNKAYNSYDGAIGSEVWVYPNSDLSIEIGNRILERVSDIGFKNRGVKSSTGLYELNSTNMPAMIIEGFFIEATEDVELYNERFDDFCRSIASGVVGYEINPTEEPTIPTEEPKEVYRVRRSWEDAKSQIGAYRNLDSAKDLCNNSPGYTVYDSSGNSLWEYVEPVQPTPVPVEPTTKEKLQSLINEIQEIVNNM
jgi:N-acetylmuramoyl-L-alanine amidase